MSSALVFEIQSFLILILMFYGVKNHAKRKKHMKIMSSAMLWDVLLILQIELTRGAIGKASKALTNPMILNIHVSIAVSCVLLYVVMIITGRKVIQGNNELLPRHRLIGRITLALRVLTFITSFFVTQ